MFFNHLTSFNTYSANIKVIYYWPYAQFRGVNFWVILFYTFVMFISTQNTNFIYFNKQIKIMHTCSSSKSHQINYKMRMTHLSLYLQCSSNFFRTGNGVCQMSSKQLNTGRLDSQLCISIYESIKYSNYWKISYCANTLMSHQYIALYKLEPWWQTSGLWAATVLNYKALIVIKQKLWFIYL